MKILRCLALVLTLGCVAVPVYAEPVLIDFETLADQEELGVQFESLGFLFSGATALLSGAAGGSLNEVDFPTFSGNAAVFDSGPDGITIDFLRPATIVSGRFTYVGPVTLLAYSGATLVGSATSLFGDNTSLSGNPQNELLSLTFGGGITQLSIVGLPGGGSFVLDDLFADLQEPVAVPEPTTVALVLLGLAAGLARPRRLV